MPAKGVELANAWVTIIPDTSKIAPQIKSAFGEVDKVAQKSGTGIGTKLSGMMGKSLKVGAASVGAAAGGVLAGAMAKGFARLSSIEGAEAKLKGLGNSAEQVSGIMENALGAVKGTAFGMGEAATVASQIVASGIKPGEDLERVLKTVGDTAAITGDSMEGMGMIFGSVAARGKLMGDDLMQLRSRGLPVMDILAESLGKTTEEVEKMASNGEISFEIFEKAMREKMGGAALEAGNTVQGALRNVGASMGRFGEAVLKPVYAASPKLLTAFGGIFDEMTNAIGPSMEQVGTILTPALENLAGVIDTNIAPAMADFAGWLGDIAVKVTEFAVDPANWESVGNVFSTLKDTAADLGPSLGDLINNFLQITGAISVATWQALGAALNALAPLITSVLVPMVEQVANFAAQNPGAVQAIVTAFLGFKAVGAIAGPLKTAQTATKSFGGALKFLGTAVKGASSVPTFLVKVMEGARSANPIISKMAHGVGSFTKVLSKVGGVIGKIVPVFGKLFGVLAKGASMFATFGKAAIGLVAANPFVAIAAGVAALVAGLVYFFTKTETGKRIWGEFTAFLGEKFEVAKAALGVGVDWLGTKFNEFLSWCVGIGASINGAWESIKGGVAGFVESVTAKWTEFTTLLQAGWELIKTTVVDVFTSAWEGLVGTFTSFTDGVVAAWTTFTELLQAGWEIIKSAVIDVFKMEWDGLVTVFTVVTNALNTAWNTLTGWLQSGWAAIKSAVVDAFVTAWNNLQARYTAVVVRIQTAWQNTSATLSAVWNVIKSAVVDAFKSAWEGLKQAFVNAVERMKSAFSSFRDRTSAVINAVKGYFTSFKNKVVDTSREVINKVKEIPSKIKNAFAGASSWLVDAGQNIINGLISGISSMAGRVGNAISEIMPSSIGGLIGFSGGGLLGFARGGVLPDVPGIPRTQRDPILGVSREKKMPIARIEPGEFVVNREATAANLPLLRAINSGKLSGTSGDLGLPGYANGGVVSAQQMIDFALGRVVNGYRASRPLQGATYVFGGSNWGDCSGTTSAFSALAVGINPFPRKYATMDEGSWLSSHGFAPGIGPRKDNYSVSFYNGGPGGGHTAASIWDSNGKETKIEMGGAPSMGHFNTGVGATHSMFTDRYHIPLKSGASHALTTGQVVGTSVDGVTVAPPAAPERTAWTAPTRTIDWGTASQLASEWDKNQHRDKAIREYLKRNARVYDTGGILPTGGLAMNLSGPELVFPAQATTAMLQMARSTPQFAQAMTMLAARVPALAAAIDKFTALDYGAIATEITDAFNGKDSGYAELAHMVGEEVAERIATEVAFIGDQIRDMQDGSNMRAYLASMNATEGVGLADRVGKMVGLKDIGTMFGGVAKGYDELQNAAVMQVDAADAVTQAEKNLTDARRDYAELLAESGADPEVSKKTQRKIDDAERKLREAKEAPAAKSDVDGAKKAKKIADAERNLARVREDAGEELKKAGAKNSEDLVKASEAVTAAENDRTKALGVVKMAARATGQAQIAMALEVAEMVIGIGKKIWGLIEQITDLVNQTRIKTRTAVWDLTKSWSELTGVVDQHRGMVAKLQMQLVNAAIDVIGKSMEMRTAQVDVVRAQLEGAKSVAEAEGALQAERDKVMGKQKWNFRDMSLEYDRFRQGYRDGMNEQIMGMSQLSEQERDRIVASLSGVGEIDAQERARVVAALAGLGGISEEERDRILASLSGIGEVDEKERARVFTALAGLGGIDEKQGDVVNQIVERIDNQRIAEQLNLDSKLAAQNAIDQAFIDSVNGREVGEKELQKLYRLNLADQLVGEDAFRQLKVASLDDQLAWQEKVDKAAQLGLEAELKARAVVTPEILALQREVYAAEFAQQKSIIDAQVKGIEATFAQQQAIVHLGRLQSDLARQQAELDRLSGQTMGMTHGQAIVMEEIARLRKENAEILGKRNSAGAGARNFFGRLFDWNGDGNGGTNTWSVERKQYDAQIAANNAQIAELQKSIYAQGAFSPEQQKQIEDATKLAAKYFAQGNEAAAKAALAASPLGNAQRSLEVNETMSRITDWEDKQRDLARQQQDAFAELQKDLRVLPLQWQSEELGSKESAQRYAADALRSDNPGVRAALAELSRLEDSNAAELKQLREQVQVVNLTVPGPRDGVTTIGQMEDALGELAEALGVTIGDVRRLKDGQRTSAADRVRAALGK